LASVAEGAGTEILTGTSLKAALDLDWDDPQAHNGTVYNMQTLNSVESWVKQKQIWMTKQCKQEY